MSEKELFVRAFLEAEKTEYKDYLNKDIEWQPSEKFINKMNSLINKNNRIKFTARHRISRSLVAALVAILIAFAGTMSVSATRAPFVEFVKKVFPHYVEFSLSKDSTPSVNAIEKEYTLSEVPQGYKMTSYDKTQYHVTTTWKDGDKEIYFDQSIQDGVNTIDNEHEHYEVEVNGNYGYLSVYEKETMLWWIGDDYTFTLCVPSQYKDDIIKIAESIKEKN